MSLTISPSITYPHDKVRHASFVAIANIPLYTFAVTLASLCTIIGIMWDISWHTTIGRDAFLSPPHMLIYAGTIFGGLFSGIQRVDSATFRTILPALPKGKYLVFADFVYGSGFTETIKDTFNLEENLVDSLKKLDKEDAYAFALRNDLVDNLQVSDVENTIICGKPGTGVKLRDGSNMVWEGMTNEPLEAGKMYNLSFNVFTPDKQPAVQEPYLGMAGHAAIIRNDGNVYIHLHPVGTFSMAAETNFKKRLADPRGEYKYPDPKPFRDSIDNIVKQLSVLSEEERNTVLRKQMNMQVDTTKDGAMTHSNMVSFPYSFPSPGNYRIWVQVKRNGQVLTAAFDKVVK